MAHWRDFLDPAAPPGGYLPWKEVARRTSLSRTTAWRLQRRDEFPRAYAISPGRVGHLECEVEAWIACQARPGAGAGPRPVTSAPLSGRSPPKATPPDIASAAPLSREGPPQRRASPPELSRPARPSRRPRSDQRPGRVASQQMMFDF
jgi:predicted DNA-binding transcriptional regulator AlpA